MWGRLSLAGLLLAGCAFDPRGSSSSTPDADAAGGSDARPGADASPGAFDASDLPDGAPIEPVLLETLTVEAAEEDPIQSTVVLVAGRTYRLVASGEVVVRDDDLGEFEGDADYWYNGIIMGDTSSGVDMGLAVNDTQIDGDRSPDWGGYADSHVYQTTLPGTGSTLTAQFHDHDYGNGNSGSLTLEIWGPPL